MIYEAMNYCSDRGKEMLKELLSGRPQSDRKQDKNGKPAPGGNGNRQKRTGDGEKKKTASRTTGKTSEKTYVPYAEKKERGWAVSKKGAKSHGTKKGAKYTKRHPPVRFEAAWQSETRSEASRLEYRLKWLTKAEKEALISGNLPENADMAGYVRAEIPGNTSIC